MSDVDRFHPFVIDGKMGWPGVAPDGRRHWSLATSLSIKLEWRAAAKSSLDGAPYARFPEVPPKSCRATFFDTRSALPPASARRRFAHAEIKGDRNRKT
jgi:hypothetical protein